MEFTLETKIDIPKYKMLILLLKEDNKIAYDYDIYSISIKDKVIGYIVKYKVPSSCYIDIFILPNYRNKGYGSIAISLFTDKFLSDYNEVYIRSNQEDKNKFLLNNNFNLVKENLNKNLYLKVLKS